jgi:penicillin-binding protein 1A
MDTVIAVARRMGIRSPIVPYPSSAIGASAVHPLELVTAYSAFANLGPVAEPRFLVRVDDRAGRAVWTAPAPTVQGGLQPAVAFVVRDMMRDAVDHGTGVAVRRAIPAGVPVAGKTGTTNGNTDVWFVGLTPDIVAGVWLGFDAPQTITPGAAGGSLAAPVFGEMMARYYETRGGFPDGERWSAMPEGVVTAELDRSTGLPVDAGTPAERRYTEYFLAGTEPGAQRVDPWKIFQWGPIVF